MKKLEIHVGNISVFLKFGDGDGYGYGYGYGYGSRYVISDGFDCVDGGYGGGYGEGYGSGNGYYKTKDRQLVGDNE